MPFTACFATYPAICAELGAQCELGAEPRRWRQCRCMQFMQIDVADERPVPRGHKFLRQCIELVRSQISTICACLDSHSPGTNDFPVTIELDFHEIINSEEEFGQWVLFNFDGEAEELLQVGKAFWMSTSKHVTVGSGRSGKK